MKVAFLADPLYYRIQSGIARYTYELTSHLGQRDDIDLRLFSLYSREQIASAPGAAGLPAAQSAHSSFIPRPAQYLLWHWLGLTGKASASMREADVVHTPLFFVPPASKCPLVVTAHDLSFALHPQHLTFRNRLVSISGLRRAVKDASIFIADSEATALDLQRLAGVARKRIVVVPLAADNRFVPTAAPDTLKRYGIEGPYVLYVGNLEPRKNLITLLKAFTQLNLAAIDAALGAPLKLAIVGVKGWMYQDIFVESQRVGLTDRIVFTGYVQDADLPALYSGAKLFVYPSIFEGFGLPVLEAMQCGAPVITSNVSSLPEVAGDAALLVSPYDVAELSRLMMRVLTEPNLQAELRGKSLARAQCFSWQKTADMTRQVYQNAQRL